MLSLICLGLLLPSLLEAVPINNGLDGEPEVQCGSESVTMSFTTTAPYEGVVYAKNHFGDEGCVNRASGGTSGSSIEIGFDQCNARRFRSIDPRGVFVTLTVVVQFHQSVLTKVDRAFHIRCFYMEADKTVDAQLEVSMVTTDLVTLTVPMPVCRYEILDEAGNPLRFALIGDKIVHKWTCDTETVDTFCMEVYSCYVDDALGGAPLNLIDENGCSLDGNLVPNPEYPTDLMAEAPSHVFKWADRPALYFNCQVRIGIKEPGSGCEEWRSAQGGGPCAAEPTTLGRKKRSLPATPTKPSGPGVEEVDLAPNFPLYVADLEMGRQHLPSSAPAPSPSRVPSAGDVCISSLSVGVVALLLLGLLLAATAMAALLFARCK